MAINKIVYGSATLVDLTSTTATADKILSGYGAFGRDGNWMDGTATQGGGIESVTQDQDGYVVLDDDEGNQIAVNPLSVTNNGTYTAPTGHAYSPVSVNVTPTISTQTKTVSPTTSQQTITPDQGYDALSSVTVNAMPTGSATAPASISGTGAGVTVGTNRLTLSKTVSVTPTVSAGYISAGTAGNSSVSLQANIITKGRATYHPSTSNQTVSDTQYLTGVQTFNAVTMTNLIAGNIKNGVTIEIGDASDSDCVASVTGTYEGGGGGGSGLEYEEGTWTPSQDIEQGSISFNNTHTTKPFFIGVYLVSPTTISTTWTMHRWTFVWWANFTGYPDRQSDVNLQYAEYRYTYKGSGSTFNSGTANVSNPNDYDTTVSTSGFTPYDYGNGAYFRAGLTYKWIAIWAPTT